MIDYIRSILYVGPTLLLHKKSETHWSRECGDGRDGVFVNREIGCA